ncbi:hypothetical protein AWC38_SpisGene7063 [Stylophora pistillata]|uniref:Uncharacterized protein n=1 Tax=Stylophora pistillata TaxID=50429 RepID=A0A2B4SC29_STYPI|nr:hypothetical protein AWC38_SpisGene7063 [Stylophora pistillata]
MRLSVASQELNSVKASAQQAQREREQAKSAIATKEKLEKTRTEDIDQIWKQSRQRDEQLTTLLQETEARHAQCRTELRQMLEAEIQVCNKMKEECKRLTEQLEDSTDKSRAKVQDANKEYCKLKKELNESLAQKRTLEEQNSKKDKHIHELQSRLKQNDENTRKCVSCLPHEIT